MAARQEAHEGFGAALDRIAARLAHPLAAFDIAVDLGGAQRLESDDRIDDANARTAVGADDADARPNMVAPARQQAEHPPEVGFVSGFFEDAAADRTGRVARQDPFVRRAPERERLAPPDPGARSPRAARKG